MPMYTEPIRPAGMPSAEALAVEMHRDAASATAKRLMIEERDSHWERVLWLARVAIVSLTHECGKPTGICAEHVAAFWKAMDGSPPTQPLRLTPED